MYFDRTAKRSQRKVSSIGRFDAIVIALFAIGSAYACWSLYVVPIGGIRVAQVWVLIMLSGVILHRLLRVFQRHYLSDVAPVLSFLAHVLRWILTLVLASLFTSFVNTQTDAREQRDIAQRLAPVLEFIDQSFARNGQYPQDLSEFLKRNPIALRFYYQHSNDAYVIGLRGGSIDIDGSTVFYDSQEKSWSRIHNDALGRDTRHPAAMAYLALTKNMVGRNYP